MTADLYTVTPAGQLQLHFHQGQRRAWDSIRRVVAVIAGAQSGKSVFGPPWLHREIQRKGPGDYMVVTPTYPLLSKKALPEFLRYFGKQTLDLGDYNTQQKLFVFSPEGSKRTFGRHDGVTTQVYFGHAQDPESLESATAKAAWLDEAGQNKFRLGSWEAIKRRLAIHQGRVLITTTPYCYDESMEVYTRRGWQSFGALTSQDEVMACTPEGNAHFEKPSAITWEPYSGPMIRMKGGRVDLLVTPNHRILYRNSARFYTAPAAEFVQKKYRYLVIPKTVRLRGDFPSDFFLPAVPRGHRWGPGVRASAGAIAIPMADWCAFLGWFLSEGCVRGCNGGKITRGGYRVDLSQNDGVKKDQMRADLARLPFRWSEHAKGFMTSNKQLWAYLSALGSSGTKRVPQEIKQASPADLRVLIDRMVLGDGSSRKDRTEIIYYTTSPQLAEDFREVCMLAGISCHLRERQNTRGGTIKGRPIESTRSIFHVRERQRQGAIVQEYEVVQYSGHIGCVTVSTGYVLVRRNGEECICGNSLGWLKQQVYDRWKDGNQTYDVVNFKSIDNPAFPRQEYDDARASLPGWRFRMFYDGLFERPAGLIYDCWDDTLHRCPRFAVPPAWPRYLGLDFGGVHTAGVFFAEEPGTGKLYAYREYLAGGRTAKEHVAALVAGEPGLPVCCGGSKSEQQWRDEFAAAGLPVREPVVTDVEVGIGRVYGAIKRGEFTVFNDLAGLLDELASYSRPLDDAGNPTEGIEDKESYHRLDACRYIVSWLKREDAGPFEPTSDPRSFGALSKMPEVW